MVSWQFQYWNGSGWVNFANAQIDHILEELSSVGGQEELAFALPNTAANRTIVQALPYVQCLFNGTVIFPLCNQGAVIGQAAVFAFDNRRDGLQRGFRQAQPSKPNNHAGLQRNRQPTPFSQRFAAPPTYLLAACPTFTVSITFNNANCFKAAQSLATACGMDYWADADGFNIGTRDSTVQTLGWIDGNSKRGLDYSKTVDYVIVNGVNSGGLAIQGSAGTPGGSVATFTEKKACDVATLNNVAAAKLQKLNNPSNGNSLECLITQVATLASRAIRFGEPS